MKSDVKLCIHGNVYVLDSVNLTPTSSGDVGEGAEKEKRIFEKKRATDLNIIKTFHFKNLPFSLHPPPPRQSPPLKKSKTWC